MPTRTTLSNRILIVFIFAQFFAAIIMFFVVTTTCERFSFLESFLEPDVPTQIQCHDAFSTNESFPELNASREREIHFGLRKNIFFLETSCLGETRLTYRQACSVEAAARANPGMMVNLFYLSPAPPSNLTKRLVQQLLEYDNIQVSRLKLAEFIQGTPIEDWYSNGRALAQSSWPNTHASDFFRLLTLWKYGGIYLDLDFVVTKSLDDLTNFVGFQNPSQANSAIIGFIANKLGFKVSNECLRVLMDTYNSGNGWDGSSVDLLTGVVEKLCDTKNLENMTLDQCHGLQVLPPSVFYPVDYTWPERMRLFRTNDSTETMQRINDARAIHMWDSLTKNETVLEGSPYAQVAEKYCPLIYNHRDGEF